MPWIIERKKTGMWERLALPDFQTRQEAERYAHSIQQMQMVNCPVRVVELKPE